MENSEFAARRHHMVEKHLIPRGIRDQAVLRAFREVPRHLFVPRYLRALAYADRPLPIGMGQTISQPFVVALMVQELELTPDSSVLEIGTGSGYGTAVLSRLAARVYTVERHPDLAREAQKRLADLGCNNVVVSVRDGAKGWAEKAPFDGIVVTAAAREIPRALLDQLTPGGRLVIPVGHELAQDLIRIDKRTDGSITRKNLGDVRFVPLVTREW